MRKIEIYEEALCCPTGVCGPTVREELVWTTAVQRAVHSVKEIRFLRYNLAQNPGAFVRQPVVQQLLDEEGMTSLPITIVDGQVVKTGTYPSYEEFEKITGMKIGRAVAQKADAENKAFN